MKQKRLSIFLLGILGTIVFGAVPSAAATQTFTGNMPKFPTTATNMGAVAPGTMMNVTLWLNPHSRNDLDTLAKQVTNPKSSNFQHFLTSSELASRFAPTAAEASTVQSFLTSHQLQVVRVGPQNFYVRAQGTAANVAAAFHVQMSNFKVNGQIVRGNTNEPSIDGPAGALVGAIYGLDSMTFTHPVITQSSLTSKLGSTARSGLSNAASSTGGAPSDASFFSDNCFSTGNTKNTFSANGVTITAKGNSYGPVGNVYGCGYTPADIRAAYNLNPLYQQGLDGTGQTILIVDWCGSPTITSDANAFSAKFGLPALTSQNFKIIDYPVPATCGAPDAEINLDVEWAHAIAPGAKIDLIVPPSPSFNDVDEGVFFAVTSGLGNVISNSYGSEEYYTPTTILITEDLINEIAAVMGVSNNYSSGDDGDFTFDLNDPQYVPPSVSAPADSPYATAVGGVTLVLDANKAIKFQTGWGNNQDILVDQGSISDPITGGYFYAGSGGGPSQFFGKPFYQSALPGSTRQVPDISWLADPYTGGIIAISNPEVYPSLQYESIGGTSLACPMFSALWAIANQAAGHPLGQAAPYLYYMPAGTITDMLPVGSSTNVSAKVTDATGTTTYTADQVAAPLENTTTYYSALWMPPLFQDTWVVVTFGTDSGLTITPGWDNVTGLGVPNGAAFVNYFK